MTMAWVLLLCTATLLFAQTVIDDASETPSDFKHKVELVSRKSHESNTFQIMFQPSNELSLLLLNGVELAMRSANHGDGTTDEDNFQTASMEPMSPGFGQIAFQGPPIQAALGERLSYFFVYRIEGKEDLVHSEIYHYTPDKYLLPQIHPKVMGGFRDDDENYMYRVHAELTDQLSREVKALQVFFQINYAHEFQGPIKLVPTVNDGKQVGYLTEFGIPLNAGDTLTYYFSYLAPANFTFANMVNEGSMEDWTDDEISTTVSRSGPDTQGGNALKDLKSFESQVFVYTVTEPRLGHDFMVTLTETKKKAKMLFRKNFLRASYRIEFAMPSLVPSNDDSFADVPSLSPVTKNKTEKKKPTRKNPVVDFRYRINKGDHYAGFFMKYDEDKHVWYYDGLRLFFGLEMNFFFSFRAVEDSSKLVNTEILTYSSKTKEVRDQHSDLAEELANTVIVREEDPFIQRPSLVPQASGSQVLSFKFITEIKQEISNVIVMYKILPDRKFTPAPMTKENPVTFVFKKDFRTPFPKNATIVYFFRFTAPQTRRRLVSELVSFVDDLLVNALQPERQLLSLSSPPASPLPFARKLKPAPTLMKDSRIFMVKVFQLLGDQPVRSRSITTDEPKSTSTFHEVLKVITPVKAIIVLSLIVLLCGGFLAYLVFAIRRMRFQYQMVDPHSSIEFQDINLSSPAELASAKKYVTTFPPEVSPLHFDDDEHKSPHPRHGALEDSDDSDDDEEENAKSVKIVNDSPNANCDTSLIKGNKLPPIYERREGDSGGRRK